MDQPTRAARIIIDVVTDGSFSITYLPHGHIPEGIETSQIDDIDAVVAALRVLVERTRREHAIEDGGFDPDGPSKNT